MIDHILIDTYRRLEKKQLLSDPEDPDILAYIMEAIVLLQTSLKAVKEHVCDAGFISTQHEVAFFKHTKPELLGNLMFYNKVFRIESASPRS